MSISTSYASSEWSYTTRPKCRYKPCNMVCRLIEYKRGREKVLVELLLERVYSVEEGKKRFIEGLEELRRKYPNYYPKYIPGYHVLKCAVFYPYTYGLNGVNGSG